ncbi:MAG: hypothetical protein CMG55_10310 [Candidatus Marinimicrobia bacterium]|nr:hypothetical protein [Candidatus Neomarinimicrobiota bacterium]|tara:strand:+ start:153 stop:662 length:510 start_codon:yes stop_codon:yes gene_type:complete
MVKYDLFNNDLKQDFKNQLIRNTTSLGGKNHFLSLIEAIRIAHPHPLMSKDASFRYSKGSIKWEKVIYKDKVDLLMTLIKKRESDKNLMPEKGNRNYKKIRNLMRTIGPIKFEVRPKNSKDGDGFIFNCIDIIDKNTCQLSFMFEVLFVFPIKLIKRIYTAPRETINVN